LSFSWIRVRSSSFRRSNSATVILSIPAAQRSLLPAATLHAVVPGYRPSLRPSHVALFSSVTSLSTKDCRVARGSLALSRMSVDLPGSSDRYPLNMGFEHPRSVFWFLCCCNSNSIPQRCHCRLSSTAFHVPTTKLGHPGLILTLFLVVRVLSSTLLPGFIGPESSVLPVDLPPSDPSPLQVLLIGLVL